MSARNRGWLGRLMDARVRAAVEAVLAERTQPTIMSPWSALVGGPYDGLGIRVDRRHHEIVVGQAGARYRAITDPDTGEHLGGYVIDRRTCAGRGSNVCVAEGCVGEACEDMPRRRCPGDGRPMSCNKPFGHLGPHHWLALS